MAKLRITMNKMPKDVKLIRKYPFYGNVLLEKSPWGNYLTMLGIIIYCINALATFALFLFWPRLIKMDYYLPMLLFTFIPIIALFVWGYFSDKNEQSKE